MVTAKFLASISAAAGITSLVVNSTAVLAICRCSSEKSSGVNMSCGLALFGEEAAAFDPLCRHLRLGGCHGFASNSDSRKFPRRPCRRLRTSSPCRT